MPVDGYTMAERAVYVLLGMPLCAASLVTWAFWRSSRSGKALLVARIYAKALAWAVAAAVVAFVSLAVVGGSVLALQELRGPLFWLIPVALLVLASFLIHAKLGENGKGT